ncbi:hypothetical protein F5146DRAFT_245565 [Armillaria mellea]|nr:hypothetical protein F5146DRAFT_245565 [Armillaria mellea]
MIDAFEFAPRNPHQTRRRGKICLPLASADFVFLAGNFLLFFSKFFRNASVCKNSLFRLPKGSPNSMPIIFVTSCILLNHIIVRNWALLPRLIFPSLNALSLDQNWYTDSEAISDVCDLIG